MKEFAASVASEVIEHVCLNVKLGERMAKKIKDRKQAELMKASIIKEKLLIWHANDLFDQSTMKKRISIARNSYGSIGNTI